MSDPELIVLQVSSSCDDLLDQLNAISFLGDEHHRDRCTHLRHSLTHLNRAQGLGFEVFGTVIDRRMLAKGRRRCRWRHWQAGLRDHLL